MRSSERHDQDGGIHAESTRPARRVRDKTDERLLERPPVAGTSARTGPGVAPNRTSPDSESTLVKVDSENTVNDPWA